MAQPIKEARVLVVGLGYYNGEAARGEKVRMFREKHNRHDRNAIYVTNNRGQKIGYVKRSQAMVLATLFDRARFLNLKIEGRMYTQANHYNQELHLQVYSTEDNPSRRTIQIVSSIVRKV